MDDATPDDATLTISISPEGFTRLHVEDELIGFVEDICIQPLVHPTPNVRVKFISTMGLPPGPEKLAVLEKLHHFRELLLRCPQVILFEEVETIPGMMAVTPSSLPPAEQSGFKDG